MFQHGSSPRSRSPDLETLPHIDLPHRHAQHDSDSDDDDRARVTGLRAGSPTVARPRAARAYHRKRQHFFVADTLHPPYG